jgi:cold shock CspA family protein
MITGLVVDWIDRKKFGFILPDGSDSEIFIHITDCPGRQPLAVNTRVSFELGAYGGRKKATQVRVIGAPEGVAMSEVRTSNTVNSGVRHGDK